MIALSLGLMASSEDGFQKSGEFAKSIERYSEEMRSILGDAGVRLVR